MTKNTLKIVHCHYQVCKCKLKQYWDFYLSKLELQRLIKQTNKQGCCGKREPSNSTGRISNFSPETVCRTLKKLKANLSQDPTCHNVLWIMCKGLNITLHR